MSNAYVLMTAMPPTKGHLHLIQFATQLGNNTTVIVATRPGEPYEYERVFALRNATKGLFNVTITHLRKDLPQEPEQAIGFWDMWAGFLTEAGLTTDDYIVSSEPYGIKLEEYTGATFVPYDPGRFIDRARATTVRNNPFHNFDMILPEFQNYVMMPVTIFGAESCGKTTLTRDLGEVIPAHTIHEWARPYLEMIGPEKLDREAMIAIARGQTALQNSVHFLHDKPVVLQDTDLYTTYGYWAMHEEFGEAIDSIFDDMYDLQSYLYIICPSNIPFEADPLRYGGDRREIDDQYWIDLASDNELPYYVLTETSRGGRLKEAADVIEEKYQELFGSKLAFDRGPNH